jgi:folate-binding protein YgfZ
MNQCQLTDRSIVAVSGEDAEGLLNRLFTNSMLNMSPGTARYAALLSPQGKVLFDFLVFRRPDAFWIDGPRAQAADLARKLTMFKLRAQVTIEVRDDLTVSAAWGGVLMAAPGPTYRDPRHNDLGYRIVAPLDQLPGMMDDIAAYEAHRVGLGIPKGGVDFAYGDTFVHDANMDLLDGVDFEKGCYVGQEVVSRVHHRGSARKRIVRLVFYGDPPKSGSGLTSGTLQIGQVTSIVGREGLATARIDRLEEAEATNVPVLAGETLVGVALPTRSQVARPAYADDVP